MNNSDRWVFATNTSKPTYLVSEGVLIVQMLIHPAPTRMYFGDEFSSKGEVVPPSRRLSVDIPISIDRFENTPYLTVDEISLLHGSADLGTELSKVSRVILRVGFVACGSEITLALDREWKASDNICGTTIENLQAVIVTEARLHLSARSGVP